MANFSTVNMILHMGPDMLRSIEVACFCKPKYRSYITNISVCRSIGVSVHLELVVLPRVQRVTAQLLFEVNVIFKRLGGGREGHRR